MTTVTNSYNKNYYNYLDLKKKEVDMFYDIFIVIFNIFEMLFKIIGLFTFFYFFAWIGARYESRHQQRKKV